MPHMNENVYIRFPINSTDTKLQRHCVTKFSLQSGLHWLALHRKLVISANILFHNSGISHMLTTMTLAKIATYT